MVMTVHDCPYSVSCKTEKVSKYDVNFRAKKNIIKHLCMTQIVTEARYETIQSIRKFS
jgi:hypothetical protein